jgi:hypothetical protein
MFHNYYGTIKKNIFKLFIKFFLITILYKFLLAHTYYLFHNIWVGHNV